MKEINYIHRGKVIDYIYDLYGKRGCTQEKLAKELGLKVEDIRKITSQYYKHTIIKDTEPLFLLIESKEYSFLDNVVISG